MTVLRDQVVAASGVYLPTGTLLVNLAAPAAVVAGAQWRRSGTSAWRASGAAETDVASGTCTLEFRDVAGFSAPLAQALPVLANQLNVTSATYTDPQCGYSWATCIGGRYSDYANGVALDGAGNIYVTGASGTPGWVSGGYDLDHNGDLDVFVVKISPAGQHLWSTFLGGAAQDIGRGITVDGAGNILVVGMTFSPGWLSGGWDAVFNLDGKPSSYNGDAFVIKLAPSGAPLWGTYLGGSNYEAGYGIAVDSAGRCR